MFDYAAAMYAVIGVLAALRIPEREAVRIEVPILAAGLAWDFGRLIDPGHAEAEGTRLEYALQGSDGKWICMNAITDEQFTTMCEVIGREDLSDREDLSTFPQRRSRAAELNEVVRSVIATRPSPHARLPIYGIAQRTLVEPTVLGGADEGVRARGWAALR
jgi:crotonobetainyl-CoA:carnitine CoA-transferase CaiB-like acyl-CoA transferase